MTNEIKQSSIEWLEEEVYKIINEYEPFACSYYLEKAFEQAKEMHKQEITDALRFPITLLGMSSEEYYNKIFDK